MFRFPLIWLLLAGASAIAQIPLRTTDHEIREVQLTAKATSELLIIDLTIANGWHAYSRDVGGGNPVAIVVRAHLAALRTRRDLEARYTQRVARHRRAN